MEPKLGIVTREKDGYQVVFERTFNHPIEVVWDAITNPKKLKIWFTDFEMTFKPGGDMNIIFRDARKTVTRGKIITIDPPHKFVWTWEDELAEWQLAPEGKNKCKLVFIYSKIKDQSAVGTPGGFHTLLNRLALALEGRTATYPFGTEEHDPEQVALRETYGNVIFDQFPELVVHYPYKLERAYAAPIEKVWAAITEKEQLKKWYFDFAEGFSLTVGHTFEWKAGPPNGKQWLHRGQIVEVIEGRKLAHTWEYPGYEGKAKVIWELTAVDKNTTRLNFTFEILIPFASGEEALQRKNFVAGWTDILQRALPEYLKKS